MEKLKGQRAGYSSCGSKNGGLSRVISHQSHFDCGRVALVGCCSLAWVEGGEVFVVAWVEGGEVEGSAGWLGLSHQAPLPTN